MAIYAAINGFFGLGVFFIRPLTIYALKGGKKSINDAKKIEERSVNGNMNKIEPKNMIGSVELEVRFDSFESGSDMASLGTSDTRIESIESLDAHHAAQGGLVDDVHTCQNNSPDADFPDRSNQHCRSPKKIVCRGKTGEKEIAQNLEGHTSYNRAKRLGLMGDLKGIVHRACGVNQSTDSSHGKLSHTGNTESFESTIGNTTAAVMFFPLL